MNSVGPGTVYGASARPAVRAPGPTFRIPQSAIRNRRGGAMKEVTVPELLRTLEGLWAKLDGLGGYL